MHSRFSLISRRQCLTSKVLIFEKHGDPLCVVRMVERPVPFPDGKDVMVRMMAAPINPTDINIIQGKFPELPALPCIPGNEGVGIVEEIGREVQTVEKGDKVIFSEHVQGTWRSLGIFPEDKIRRIPDDIDLAESATLMINPGSAYRMLSDFKPLRKNKLVVIQNGPNGVCGLNVIKLCNIWGIPNINIIKAKPNADEQKAHLIAVGATHVLTDDELARTKMFKDKTIDLPSLALNCIGGKNALRMITKLSKSGVMVTYGGMTQPPVILPTGPTIFKTLTFKGFRMAAWNANPDNKSDKYVMLSELTNLMHEQKLTTHYPAIVPLYCFKEALNNTMHSKDVIRRTYILDFANM